MKRSFYSILLVLIPIIYSETINAQKDTIKAQKLWTLEDCIGYALDNNLQIKRQELQTEISKNNLLQSKIDLAPDLNAGENHYIGGGHLYNTSSYTESQKENYGSAGIQSSLTIFSGFQKLNTIKVNRFSLLGAMQDLEKIKNDISLNIAGGYLQILYNKELLEVAKSQLEVSKLQIEKTKKLFEVGNVAKGSLLDIQATAASEEANMITAQNNLNISYLTLAQMLDLDTLKNFSIFIPVELNVPESFSENADSIYKIALNNMPQIKSAEYNLKRSKSSLAVANGGRFPQLILTGTYGTQYDFYDSLRTFAKVNDTLKLISTNPYNFTRQLGDKKYWVLNFTLNIPIFRKYEIQKEISNAKIQVKDAEFALQQSQLQLRKDIEQAYADALASFENYKARFETVNAQEEDFKYVQQKFDVGLINSVDYNVAKNNYSKAKSDLLQAKYDFIFKTKILEFYKGNVIKL